MTDNLSKRMVPCGECGMICDPAEFHPMAACLMFKGCHDGDKVRSCLEALASQAGTVDGTKLWLWKNGDHYLAFTHEYPCFEPGGDPMTLGNPAATAVFKTSYDRAQHDTASATPKAERSPHQFLVPPLPAAHAGRHARRIAGKGPGGGS